MHQKRAYLYRYLSSVDVPPELEQDEDIAQMINQVQLLQDQFKETHKFMENVRQNGNNSAQLKREIQMMEEEKQQVQGKIERLKKKVDTFVRCFLNS